MTRKAFRRLRLTLRMPSTIGQLTAVALLGTLGLTAALLLGYTLIQNDRMATKRGACVSLGDALYVDTAHLHAAQAARGCPIGGIVTAPNLPPVDLPPADSDLPPEMAVTVSTTTTATATRTVVAPGSVRLRTVQGPDGRVTTVRVTLRPTAATTVTRTCLPLNLNCR